LSPDTRRQALNVERYLLRTHHFNSRENLAHTLLRYVALYNHQLPQSALGSKTPIQAIAQRYRSDPALFAKQPYKPGNRAECERHIGNPVLLLPTDLALIFLAAQHILAAVFRLRRLRLQCVAVDLR
jgi:hypothetical protein